MNPESPQRRFGILSIWSGFDPPDNSRSTFTQNSNWIWKQGCIRWGFVDCKFQSPPSSTLKLPNHQLKSTFWPSLEVHNDCHAFNLILKLILAWTEVNQFGDFDPVLVSVTRLPSRAGRSWIKVFCATLNPSVCDETLISTDLPLAWPDLLKTGASHPLLKTSHPLFLACQ